MPDLQGCVLTLDALHTVEETFEQIVNDKNGNYLVCVKNNASNLLKTITTAFEKNEVGVVPTATTLDKEHGRIEQRVIEVLPTTPMDTGWPHTHAICRVYRESQLLRRGEVVKERKEMSHYVSSLPFASHSPEFFQQSIRGHWGIENSLHHRKDRSMDEDRNRATKNVGRILCYLRSFAAVIHSKAKESGLSQGLSQGLLKLSGFLPVRIPYR